MEAAVSARRDPAREDARNPARQGSWLACFSRRPTAGDPPALEVTVPPGDTPPLTATRRLVTAVFDGELHDRRELARRLARPDADDAALVLEAYVRFGENFLDHLRGCFALLVWDASRDMLLAARDQIGMHPLFYAGSRDELLVSPSIDALRRHPSVPARLHTAALADYLSRRLAYWTEDVFFRGISRLGPGHVARADSRGLSIRRYWEPVVPADDVKWAREDELDQFDELLGRAVQRAVGTDRVGILLSGGFDSVSVAAIAVDRARTVSEPRPLALSLAFPDPACDESIIQRAVAKHLGMTQILLRFDRAVEPHGMLWSALALNREWPTPMIDPWRPAYRTLKTQGRERGCTRVLTGTGGDEWLNVTSRFLADQLGQLDLAGAARTIRTTLRSYRLPLLAHLRIMIWKYGLRPLLGSYVARGLAAWAPGVLAAHRRRDLMSATPAWVAPDDTIRRECAARVDASVERMNDLPRFKGPYRFYFADLPGMFLHPLNQMDMEERFESAQRIGVSERHPYWDPDLVRFLCRVPPDLLTRGGRTKALVRATVARRFPALGFERHKKVSGQDFFIRAMRTEGPDCWRRLGGLETLGNLGVVDARAAERDVLQRLATDRNAPQHLWILLNLESWVRAHA